MSREIWIDTLRGRLFSRRWEHGTAVGERAPIILFHDSLGCVELWREFPQQLSLTTGRSVIAYDRLGFGQSDPHPEQLSLNFIGAEAHDAFAALRTQLGIKTFVAFGHSVGGAMAVVAAAAFPEHCRALITEAAQVFAEERTLEGIRQAKRTFAQADQLARLRKYHGDKAEWVLNAWTGTWLSPGFASWSLDQELPRLPCPVLAIHGDNDEYGSTQHPERIRALAPQASVKILPNCGHVPHREQERVVVDEVAKFLGRVAD